MPWIVEKGHGCPSHKPWAVVNKKTGEKVACHPSKDAATQQQKALYAKYGDEAKEAVPVGDCGCNDHDWSLESQPEARWDGPAAMAKCSASDTPASCFRAICAAKKSSGDPNTQDGWALPHHTSPGAPADPGGVSNALARLNQTQGIDKAAARRHLERHQGSQKQQSNARPLDGFAYRAVYPGLELRDSEDDMPTLYGHFVRFNEWTEINSIWEGRFLERFHSKSMDATFAEDRGGMRVLFQHGRDPQIGDKPLGPIAKLEAQRSGGYYEVPLLDTAYNRDLVPGLRAGLYGASFRFQAVEESWNKKPEKSDHNPEGIPERTVLSAYVPEFGPVTFPAYKNATAGVRSITDRFVSFPVRETGLEIVEIPAGNLDGDLDAEPGNGEASTVIALTWKQRRELDWIAAAVNQSPIRDLSRR